MIVASIRIATARPTPISLKSMKERVANTLNTRTITIAALVTVPARAGDALADRVLGGHAPVVQLPDPGQDEHVVVHREPEQDHEQEQGQPVGDAAVGLEAEQLLAPAVLEHQDQHAVGSADGEQVEDDRLDRDHDRAERDQHQQERQPEHEGEHQRHPVRQSRSPKSLD